MIESMTTINNIYKHYQDRLDKVNQVFLVRSSNISSLINTITSYLVKSGGKRFRPLLTIICADLCNTNNDRYINLAAAVEFIHSATLLHDDVIDESETRRNHKTANNIWGNKASILVGDYLFSQAFELMVEDSSINVLKILSSASSIISQGEVLQLNEIGNLHLTYDNYIQIITSKTAELFAASCSIAPFTKSYNSPSKEDIKESNFLREFGLNMGIAFQIIDDAMDYSKSPKKGKNQGDDFFEGKVTLPLMLVKEQSHYQELEFLNQIFSEGSFTQENFVFVENLIDKYNAIEQSYQIALKYAEKAKLALDYFPDCSARNALYQLLYFCIHRDS